jgi:hypothetical protein
LTRLLTPLTTKCSSNNHGISERDAHLHFIGLPNLWLERLLIPWLTALMRQLDLTFVSSPVIETRRYQGIEWITSCRCFQTNDHSGSFAADNEKFKSTCGTLLERMVNTVPKTVTLGEVIKPIPVKPKIFLNLLPNGYIQLIGEVRVSRLNIFHD